MGLVVKIIAINLTNRFMLMAADSEVIRQTILAASEVIRDGHLQFDCMFVKMEVLFTSMWLPFPNTGALRGFLCGFDG